MAAGESNPEHFFVATQDRELRAAIDRVPGGASIFVSVNGLHLQARRPMSMLWARDDIWDAQVGSHLHPRHE